MALLGTGLLLAGCTSAGPTGSARSTPTPGAAPATASAEGPSTDPVLAAACATFWGDPEYTDPLSRTVLDRAATAPEVGPADPQFYAMTGDEVEDAFEDAPPEALEAGTLLADWFRTEPELGPDADAAAFRTAWRGVATACRGLSPAADWALAPGDPGTKPAALVCADVFDTPGTLTHFANANVLTSNMFKLVGRTAQQVPADRIEDVRATAELLTEEIGAVDDDGVRAALERVRAPFQDALEGDSWSEGLQEPLTELGGACAAAGYSSPGVGPQGDGGDEDGGTVDAAAATEPPGPRVVPAPGPAAPRITADPLPTTTDEGAP